MHARLSTGCLAKGAVELPREGGGGGLHGREEVRSDPPGADRASSVEVTCVTSPVTPQHNTGLDVLKLSLSPAAFSGCISTLAGSPGHQVRV